MFKRQYRRSIAFEESTIFVPCGRLNARRCANSQDTASVRLSRVALRRDSGINDFTSAPHHNALTHGGVDKAIPH